MQTIVFNDAGEVIRRRVSKETATTKLLKRLQTERGLKNQNQVADYLKVSRTTAHKWVWGDQGMKDDIAVAVAVDLGIDPALVLAELNAERSTGELRATWEQLAERLREGQVSRIL
jgi:uncharacterized protein YcaQ